MNSLFAKCRHLVGSFHHNGDLIIRLRDHQKTLDFKQTEQTTLQSECKTRDPKKVNTTTETQKKRWTSPK